MITKRTYKDDCLESVMELKKSPINYSGELHKNMLITYNDYFHIAKTINHWESYVIARDTFLQYMEKIDLAAEIKNPPRIFS